MRTAKSFGSMEGLLRHLLQVVVDRQLNLLAGNGFLRGQGSDFLSHAVDDDAALSVGAHQDIVVLPFEAKLPGKVAHAQLAVARFDLLFADLTYVPDGMRQKAVREVAAPRNGNHLEHRDVRMVRFDEGNVRNRSLGLDDYRLEFRQAFRVSELFSQVTNRNAETFCNPGEIFFD